METLLLWVSAALMGRRPFLLCWRVGGIEHAELRNHYIDVWLAAAMSLSQSEVEAMTLTDRDGRFLPFPAHSMLAWRWGGEEYSLVLRTRAQTRRRLRDLAAHNSLEFVSLTSPIGRARLTPERFEHLRARHH